MDWTQVGGDYNAAEHGGLFGRVTDYGVELVKVTFLPDCSSEFDNDPTPYLVECAEFGRYELTNAVADGTIDSAVRCWGMPDDVDWEWTMLAECLMDYTSRYHTGESSYETLEQAMRANDIPQSALINPDCYSWRPDWLETTAEEQEAEKYGQWQRSSSSAYPA